MVQVQRRTTLVRLLSVLLIVAGLVALAIERLVAGGVLTFTGFALALFLVIKRSR